jgi:hypothetical protein
MRWRILKRDQLETITGGFLVKIVQIAERARSCVHGVLATLKRGRRRLLLLKADATRADLTLKGGEHIKEKGDQDEI